MGKTIGIIAVKGGVGKTSVAMSLAADLVASHGKKVLLVDANYSAPTVGIHLNLDDSRATIHDVLAGKSRVSSAIQQQHGFDIIPGSTGIQQVAHPLKLKDKLTAIKSAYDFIILDGSPNMNEEILSTILASDVLFMVSTPDAPTLSCSVRAARFASQRGKSVAGIIVNKIRDPRYELALDEIETATGIPVVARIIDENVHVRALAAQMPVSLAYRRSRFSREIRRIGDVLTGEQIRPSFLRRLLPVPFRKEEVNRQILKEHFYISSFFEHP